MREQIEGSYAMAEAGAPRRREVVRPFTIRPADPYHREGRLWLGGRTRLYRYFEPGPPCPRIEPPAMWPSPVRRS